MKILKFSLLFIICILITDCTKDKIERINPLDSNGVAFRGWNTPVITGPSKGATYRLDWTDVKAGAYILQEDSDSSFNNPHQYEVKETHYSFSKIDDGVTYYYRVKTNTDNKDSNWSEVYKVTVDLDVARFPANFSTEVSVFESLSWELTNAQVINITYDIKLGKSEESLITIASDISQTTLCPNNLEILTNYYWQIVMHYEGKDYELPIWNFTTDNKSIPNSDIEFVRIPGGTFQMGDASVSDGEPIHTVTVSTFEMSAYEITNAQYAQYLNEVVILGEVVVSGGYVYGNAGEWNGERYIALNLSSIEPSGYLFTVKRGKENCPVGMVTWYGAKAFAEHYDIDLPREGEWEYACKGGHQFQYGTDDGTINFNKANYYWDSNEAVVVGSYPANPFGLYDMSGNVWEWCADWYGSYSSESVTDPTGAQVGTIVTEPTGALEGTIRVMRGGCYNNRDTYCQSTYRGKAASFDWAHGVGFRVVSRP